MVLHIIEIIPKDDVRSRNLETGNSKWSKKKKKKMEIGKLVDLTLR